MAVFLISAAAVAGTILSLTAAYMYMLMVLTPKRTRLKLEAQGIKGPTPSSLLLGNIPQITQIKAQFSQSNPTKTSTNHLASISHDWPSFTFPHLKLWQQLYGRMFVYSTGTVQTLCITDPNVVKEIILTTPLDLGKPAYLSKERGPLLGQGVFTASGSFWEYQRKLIAPEFFPNKIKGMLEMMTEATTSMLHSWEDNIKSNGGEAEITIDEDLRNLSQDIISKAAFGSSYSKGKDIFSKIRTLQGLMAKTVHVGVPGSRYMPTKGNWQIRRLEKEIYRMILKVVEERTRAKRETDFLQKILEGAKMYADQDDPTLKIDVEKLIVDNCKSIYFAGHETTSSTVTWSLMLLGAYPDWQARARAEVLEVCQDRIPVTGDLRNMKMLTMIIQETLRLYPPARFATRAALEDAKLNGIQVPKGMDIQVPILVLHNDPELWGPDVHEFNPERFAKGITGACKPPQAYIPFGFGARVCLGQNFAMMELKVMLSMILSKFSFSLSPAYQHSPAYRLILEPQHGVQLLIRRA
ncbi:cytochrome P450 714C2-like isoform X1 [Silene latifolia]|uniref:cytochrome P450 714C2-like isoform X1 n=2 Tax=Silene latifolia TaxID=37657 RepID=UPI003D78893E